MFGNTSELPQNENTPCHPRSPYGISKVTGFHLTEYYREAFNLHASSGILFNHESPRRGFEFVTRKTTSTVAKIKSKLVRELKLGNLDAKRDWGYAADYVRAMWLMLQQDVPDDYVIATGEAHMVREFVEKAFGYAGLNWKNHVTIDEQLFRPADVVDLVGDYSKARGKLGWEPTVRFEDIVKLMVENDLELFGQGTR